MKSGKSFTSCRDFAMEFPTIIQQYLSSGKLKNPAKLLRAYIGLSFISYLVILLLTNLGIYKIYQNAAIQEAQYDSINISQALFERESEYILNQLLVEDQSQGDRQFDIDMPANKIFDRRMREYLHTFNIIKIKVFSKSTAVVYSTDFDIIGVEDKDNVSLTGSLNGSVASFLKKKEKVWDLKGETRYDIDLVETYLPVRNTLNSTNKEEIIGSFEIYMDISRYNREVKERVLVLTLVVAVNLFLCLLGLYYLMKKGTSELSAVQDELVRLTREDGLTGIFNRRYLFQKAEDELARIRFPEQRKTRSRSVGCILLDIDHFKKFNDTYGHLTGDVILKGVAGLIASTVRDYDITGRYGGEEFMVLLPGADFKSTRFIAERIRSIIERNGVEHDGQSYTVTISAGISCMQATDEDVNTAIHRADSGLYRAKEEGRNRVGWIETEETQPISPMA